MKQRLRIWSVLLTVLVALIPGCVTTAGSPAGGGDRDRITRAEIEASGLSNAHEIVERLRPRWLRPPPSRSLNMSTRIAVYTDNSRLGGLESLRSISVNSIAAMRYLDGSTASAQLPGIGSEHVAGAIVITLRTGAR
jgi:hypothetical protein